MTQRSAVPAAMRAAWQDPIWCIYMCRMDCNAGANRGLGLGLAKKLVASGRKVLLAARTHEKGVQLFSLIH